MAQHKENDFAFPALLIIYNHGGDCTTEYIKAEMENYITLSEEDLRPYPSRNPNEPRYYQIIGNLISHNNPALFDYVNRIIPESEVGKKSPKNVFTINDAGKHYIESIINKAEEIECDEISNSQAEPETEENGSVVDLLDEKIIKSAIKTNLKGRPTTDPNIAKAVQSLDSFTCKYATLIGKRHAMFNAKDGNPYTEAHHLIPMHAEKDFFPRNLDRPSNIVTLCPLCHAKIHRGSEKERKAILRILYDNYIDRLNEEEIFISFDDLFNKYYK